MSQQVVSQTESGIYLGKTFHQRFRPVEHKFEYDIALFWLKLSEADSLGESLKWFSVHRRNFTRFYRPDYCGDASVPLETAVKSKMTLLNKGAELDGDVYFLGQLRTLGMYFSPVNFYFLRHPASGIYTHMMAEVSNTPWNERHYYLVDMASQQDTEKAFHVSPFNPLEMTYKWQITPPGEHFSLSLACHTEKKDFVAGVNMTRISLNNENLRSTLRRIPSMTIKTVAGIYWQALKLFIKRAPIYDHPKSQEPR